jgi:hypothetical protein
MERNTFLELLADNDATGNSKILGYGLLRKQSRIEHRGDNGTTNDSIVTNQSFLRVIQNVPIVRIDHAQAECFIGQVFLAPHQLHRFATQPLPSQYRAKVDCVLGNAGQISKGGHGAKYARNRFCRKKRNNQPRNQALLKKVVVKNLPASWRMARHYTKQHTLRRHCRSCSGERINL